MHGLLCSLDRSHWNPAIPFVITKIRGSRFSFNCRVLLIFATCVFSLDEQFELQIAVGELFCVPCSG